MSRIDSLLRLRGDSPLRLRRAWPRTPHHLHLEYRAEDGSLVPAQWMDDAGEVRRIARRTSRVSGLPVPVIEVAQGAVCLQPSGADRRLTALAPLLRDAGVRLISHRPERRAVVAQGQRYGKIVRDGQVERLAAPLRQLADGPVTVPHIDAIDESGGILWQRALDGCAPFDADSFESVFAAIGGTLRALHESPRWSGLAEHGAGDESALLETVLHRTAAHAPAIAAELEQAIEEVRDRLSRPGPERAILHRDLHDKQIIVQDDGRIAFIDLDTLAIGEPALDLANFIAHLELRGLQRHDDPTAFEAHRVAFLHGYDASEIDHDRLAAYQDAARLRLALVYSMRPRWCSLVPRLGALAGSR